MNITLVPVGSIDQVWSRVSDGLDRACLATGGDITAAELWKQCRAGTAFLIIAHEGHEILGASVWRPEIWATGPKLRCLALYGRNLLRWVRPMREIVLQLAKDCGTPSLVTEGLDKWDALFRRMFPKARRLRVLYEEELA